MERSSHDEIVIAREFVQAGMKLPIVYETTGFVYDEESEDDPGRSQFSCNFNMRLVEYAYMVDRMFHWRSSNV